MPQPDGVPVDEPTTALTCIRIRMYYTRFLHRESTPLLVAEAAAKAITTALRIAMVKGMAIAMAGPWLP